MTYLVFFLVMFTQHLLFYSTYIFQIVVYNSISFQMFSCLHIKLWLLNIFFIHSLKFTYRVVFFQLGNNQWLRCSIVQGCVCIARTNVRQGLRCLFDENAERQKLHRSVPTCFYCIFVSCDDEGYLLVLYAKYVVFSPNLGKFQFAEMTWKQKNDF